MMVQSFLGAKGPVENSGIKMCSRRYLLKESSGFRKTIRLSGRYFVVRRIVEPLTVMRSCLHGGAVCILNLDTENKQIL